MTQEEKAKAYDEALEKAKELLDSPRTCFDIEQLKDIFSELSESEDERIRKELLEEIESIIPHEDETDSEGLILPSYHTRIDRYKSYLEKQKDLDKMIVVSPEVWDTAIADAYENGKKDEEKQKEQKPKEPDWCHHKVDLSDCSEEYRKAYYDGWNNCNQQHSQCKAEQKPAIKLVFPKFRVGDIIRNVRDKWDKTTKRISYVDEHGYIFDYGHLGDKAGGGSFGFCYEDHYELAEQKPVEQEQPKMNIPSAGSGAMGTTPPKFKLDVKQDLPADLEKEIQEYLEKLGGGHGGFVDDLTDDDLTGFAYHFYELGLKARKEE